MGVKEELSRLKRSKKAATRTEEGLKVLRDRSLRLVEFLASQGNPGALTVRIRRGPGGTSDEELLCGWELSGAQKRAVSETAILLSNGILVRGLHVAGSNRSMPPTLDEGPGGWIQYLSAGPPQILKLEDAALTDAEVAVVLLAAGITECRRP